MTDREPKPQRDPDEAAFGVLVQLIGADGLRAVLKDADQSAQKPGVDGATVSIGTFDATVSADGVSVDFVLGEAGWQVARSVVDALVAETPQPNPDAQ